MKRTRRRGGADDENDINQEIEANMHAQNNPMADDVPDAIPEAIPALREEDPDDRVNAHAEMAQRHESIRNRNPRSLRYEQDRVGMERELETERQRNLPPAIARRVPRAGLQERLVLLLTEAIDLAVAIPAAIPAEATPAVERAEPPARYEPDDPDGLYD